MQHVNTKFTGLNVREAVRKRAGKEGVRERDDEEEERKMMPAVGGRWQWRGRQEAVQTPT